MKIETVIPPGQPGSFRIGERREAAGLDDLPESHRDLIDSAVTATMATLNADGTIHLRPVWVDADDTHILVNGARGRLNDRNIRARRQASLLLLDPSNPYRWLSIVADVEKIIDEDNPEHGQEAADSINAMSKLYLGEDVYQLRDPSGGEIRSLYHFAPRKITLFG